MLKKDKSTEMVLLELTILAQELRTKYDNAHDRIEFLEKQNAQLIESLTKREVANVENILPRDA